MAGICTKHKSSSPVKGCSDCNIMPWDVLKMSEQEWRNMYKCYDKSGKTVCKKCGFTYHNITDICPKCSHPKLFIIINTITIKSWWNYILDWFSFIKKMWIK